MRERCAFRAFASSLYKDEIKTSQAKFRSMAPGIAIAMTTKVQSMQAKFNTKAVRVTKWT